jgi:murein L,D-transpeptidase YafK
MNELNTAKDYDNHFSQNFSLLKNIFLTILTIIIFLAGVVVYGMILNLRDVTLQESMNKLGLDSLKNVNIIVDRKMFTLYLFSDTILVKKYRASFGRNLYDKKKFFNDGATPVGSYSICEIIDNHKYHKFLGLNYPSESDIVDALRNGIINQKEFDLIYRDLINGHCPTDKTILGGKIGIHGTGRFNFFLSNLPFVFNWTNGSIALSDKHIDELFDIISKGTKVVIK